jgi:hypothetical protein
MRPTAPPFRSVRVEQLRRLELCERALARAYVVQARLDERDRASLEQIAARHLASATLLGQRVRALGGDLDDLVDDDSWLFGSIRERRTLAWAEHAAIATYHDHIGDYDEVTAALFAEHLLPAHREALDFLERDSPVARLSEI